MDILDLSEVAWTCWGVSTQIAFTDTASIMVEQSVVAVRAKACSS